jgi:hypothetical protein
MFLCRPKILCQKLEEVDAILKLLYNWNNITIPSQLSPTIVPKSLFDRYGDIRSYFLLVDNGQLGTYTSSNVINQPI